MIQLISENAKANTSLAIRDASLNADDMASQSVRLKEEQLRKEEEKVNSDIITHARNANLIIITHTASGDRAQGST